MNPSPVAFANPWKNAKELPYPRLPWILLAALALPASLLMPSFLGVQFYSYVMVAVGFAYTVLMGRSLGATLPVLAGCFLCASMLGLPFGALFLALVVSVSAGSFLVTTLKSFSPLTLLLPAAAIAIAYLVTRSEALALLPLLPLPAILALSLATRFGAPRTGAICATVGGWLLSLAALVAYLVWFYKGALTPDTLRAAVEDLRNAVSETFFALRAELLRVTEEQLSLQPAEAQETYRSMLEQIRTTLSDDRIRALVSGVFNLLPALAILLSSAIAFPAQLLLNHTYFRVGLKQVLTPPAVHLTASFSAALFFLLAFLLQLLLPEGLAKATAENMFLVLLPLFFLIGVRNLAGGSAMLRGGRRSFWIFFLLAAVCCSLSLVVDIIALLAATGRITAQFRHPASAPASMPPREEENGEETDEQKQDEDEHGEDEE